MPKRDVRKKSLNKIDLAADLLKPGVGLGHAAVIILSSTYFVFQNDAIAGKT